MTYQDLYEKAIRLLDNGEITIGEYKEMIKPLEREICGWIPVSERLPEEHDWVGTKHFGTTISDIILITFDIGGTRLVKPLLLQNGKLSRPDAQTMDAIHKGWKMLAWMPLPEPYREDYELATEQMEHDVLYEPTYNPEDGSM